MVSRVSSVGCSLEVSRPERLEHVGDLGVDVLAGLGAGGERADPASGVVLGEHPADDRAAAVADAGEDDLWGVVSVICGSFVGRGVDEQVADQGDGEGSADDLGGDETGDGAGVDAGERVGEDPADGDGRVGERVEDVNQYAAPM